MINSISAENEDSIRVENYKAFSEIFLVSIFVIFFIIFKKFSKKFDKENIKQIQEDKTNVSSSPQNISNQIQNNNDKSINAFKFIKKLEEQNTVGNLSIYHDLLEMSIRLQQYDNIHMIYEIISDDFSSSLRLEITTYVLLFRAILSEIKENEMREQKNHFGELTKKYKDDLIERELELNVDIYNLLIEIHVELGDLNESWENFNQMKKSRFNLNVRTFQSLMRGHKKFDFKSEIHIERVMEIFYKIRSQEMINYNLDLYNPLIELLIRYRKLDKAEELLLELKGLKIFPCIITYSLFIKAYEESLEVDKALKLFNELRFKSLKPSEEMYESLINLTYKCNRIDYMNEVFQKMRSDKMVGNEEVYTNLMKGNYTNKNYLKTFEVFDSIPNDILNTSSITLYNIVIEAYLDCGLFRKVFPIYETIKRKTCESTTFPKPDMRTYILIIKAYNYSGRIEDAKQLYLKIKESNASDEKIFKCISEAFAQTNDSELVLWIINELKVFGFSKDLDSYAILMKLYSNQLNEEKCIQTFDEVLRENIKPNSSIYSPLMEMFIQKKKIIQAIGIYTDMKLNKCIIDENCYSSIIHACILYQKYDKAIEIIYDAFYNKIKISGDIFKIFLDQLINNKFMKINEKMNLMTMLTKVMREKEICFTKDIYERLNKLNYVHIEKQY